MGAGGWACGERLSPRPMPAAMSRRVPAALCWSPASSVTHPWVLPSTGLFLCWVGGHGSDQADLMSAPANFLGAPGVVGDML